MRAKTFPEVHLPVPFISGSLCWAVGEQSLYRANSSPAHTPEARAFVPFVLL